MLTRLECEQAPSGQSAIVRAAYMAQEAWRGYCFEQKTCKCLHRMPSWHTSLQLVSLQLHCKVAL